MLIIAPNFRLGRCKNEQIVSAIQCRIDRHAQTARLDHPAEHLPLQILARVPAVEMQEQTRSRAADLAIGDANVADWAGGVGQFVPQPGLFHHPLGACGNRIGATVEIRVLHRRQRGAINDRHARTTLGKQAGKRAPHRTGTDDGDINLDYIRHKSLQICQFIVHPILNPRQLHRLLGCPLPAQVNSKPLCTASQSSGTLLEL